MGRPDVGVDESNEKVFEGKIVIATVDIRSDRVCGGDPNVHGRGTDTCGTSLE